MSAFEALDLDARARVQLALWQKEHGDGLERLLADTIHRMRGELEAARQGINARAAHVGHPNAIAGNVGRLKADVRLFLLLRKRRPGPWSPSVTKVRVPETLT